MVRLLPCSTRSCGGPAILPDGQPYVLGSPPPHFPFRYRCSNCKRTTAITVVEWNRLPRLTLDDLKHLPGPGGKGEVDLSGLLVNDLVGAGVSGDQVEAAAEAVGPDLHLLMGR